MINKVSILGCGWLGMPLADKLVKAGYSVKGSSTREEKLPLIQKTGSTPYQINISELAIQGNTAQFLDCDALVLNFPPNRRASGTRYYTEQIRQIINHLPSRTGTRILFIGSTSVYRDDNKIIDPQSIPSPTRPSGLALLEAESYLNSLSNPVTFLRFGGLVGPDRKPGRFFRGKQHVPNGNGRVNLIHLEDCLALIGLIFSKEAWGETFNAVSDEHPTKAEFYPVAAAKQGFNPPSFVSTNQDSWKIIDNSYIKEKLGYTFLYPDPFDMI